MSFCTARVSAQIVGFETCFQDIYAQFFQGAGYFYLFNRIQLATGNLFSVAQRRVENK